MLTPLPLVEGTRREGDDTSREFANVAHSLKSRFLSHLFFFFLFFCASLAPKKKGWPGGGKKKYRHNSVRAHTLAGTTTHRARGSLEGVARVD